jgi:hypothetical protein
MTDKEKYYRDGELIPYFPEDAGKDLTVSTVVKHSSHPDTTIGFVSRIEDDPMGDAIRSFKEALGRMQKNAGIEPAKDSFNLPKIYFVEWSSAPPNDLDFFKSVTFPAVQHVNYSQLGKQLFNVQPMPVPHGGIFKYGKDIEEIKLDVEIGEEPCEENSQSTSGTALEKSGWGSAIRTFFTRASIGVEQFIKKIAGLAIEFIRFSK